MTDNKPTQELIEQWMAMTSAPIHYTKVCDSQFDKMYWPHLRVIFERTVKKGITERTGSKDGMYRYCANLNQPVLLKRGGVMRDSGLVLPFDLRQWVFLGYDTVSVVAGSKSSGKTGFLLRTVALNILREGHKVELLTNLEGGIDMLSARFSALDIEIPDPEPFTIRPVYENYHDYIKEPNTIYVIDYIDVPDGEKMYLIGHLIKKIAQKLQGLDSVAVVGLQKPPSRDLAVGGSNTLDAAMLYVALDSGKLKIVDAKVSAQKGLHPKNMQFTFQYEDEGTRFTNIEPYYGEEIPYVPKKGTPWINKGAI